MHLGKAKRRGDGDGGKVVGEVGEVLGKVLLA